MTTVTTRITVLTTLLLLASWVSATRAQSIEPPAGIRPFISNESELARFIAVKKTSNELKFDWYWSEVLATVYRTGCPSQEAGGREIAAGTIIDLRLTPIDRIDLWDFIFETQPFLKVPASPDSNIYLDKQRGVAVVTRISWGREFVERVHFTRFDFPVPRCVIDSLGPESRSIYETGARIDEKKAKRLEFEPIRFGSAWDDNPADLGSTLNGFADFLTLRRYGYGLIILWQTKGETSRSVAMRRSRITAELKRRGVRCDRLFFLETGWASGTGYQFAVLHRTAIAAIKGKRACK